MVRFVYIVDDEEEVRNSLRALMGTRPNWMVTGYPTGDAFLDGIDGRDDGVVLLDIRMPGMSGIDVLRQLQPMAARFPVVMVTGSGDIRSAVEAMKLGAVEFVEKPYQPEQLFDAIELGFAALEEARAREQIRGDARALIGRLSPRERAVLDLLIDGAPNKVIADRLGLSVRTVEVHRANLMDKLEARSLSTVLRLAFHAGLVADDTL
ncbi:response regulator [Sphingomonas sp. BGYR3]|uniref:response regulator transcription factor n=1 Tax=Sphingomonas sp. BGYR3 TaxID=2975483 RepID=UPI0021A94A3D|nr:response regulator [Sphingomonas sp. BGYR3]MDG5487121.1 response regulator [Sphingomonas sp. BGYR3]